MIPVKRQRQPKTFAARVRRPGLKWLADAGIDPNQPPPKKPKLADYWRRCIPDLRTRYRHVCAYAAIRIEEVTGSATADHFAAKSLAKAKLAYEWSNYRLVCGTMNSRKQAFSDVLDPFTLPAETFVLNLTSAKLSANPALTDKTAANATIKRLKLNDPAIVRVRKRYWRVYIRNRDRVFLKEQAPFVYYEAKRQGML